MLSIRLLLARSFLLLLLLAATAEPIHAQNAETLKNAQALLDSGINCYRRSEYDKALAVLTTGAKMAQDHNDTSYEKVLIRCYNNIGNVYADKGDNPRALQSYQQALAIAEQAKDEKNAAHINKNIGAVFVSMQRLDEAIACYKRSEQIAVRLSDDLLLADCYNNEGTVYEQQKEYDKAMAVYKDALAYYEKARRPESIAMTLNNIAIVYKYRKDYAQALQYNMRSLDTSRTIDDKWAMAATLNNIGNIYGETGDARRAADYCSQSIALARSINAIQIVIAAYESLAGAAAHTGNFKDAYSYFRQYTSAKDSFINTENNRQLSELQVKYEAQKKQAENDQLRFDNKLATEEKDRAEKNGLFIICFAIVLLASGSLVAWLAYRNSMARAKAEEEQMLNRTMYEVEQKERMRIARDLHDSIGQMIVAAKMQLMAQPEEQRLQNEKTGLLLDDALREVRDISHNLLPEGLNAGLVKALRELCRRSGTGTVTVVELTVAGDEEEYQLSQEQALSVYRIVQEVTGNMLKYAEARSIDISLDTTPGAIDLRISDDGKGFDTGTIKTSKGMGWRNIMARVNLMGGTINIMSAAGKGTRIHMLLPRS